MTFSSTSRRTRASSSGSAAVLLVPLGAVLDVLEPVVDEAEVVPRHGGLHAAAAVVTADDDVPHPQPLHRVEDHGEHVEVGVDDLVGDVAVDEQVAGLAAGDVSAGTRLSEQPIHTYSGSWPSFSRDEVVGAFPCARTQRSLYSRRRL